MEITELTPEFHSEALALIHKIQEQEQLVEKRRQIGGVFLDKWLWLGCLILCSLTHHSFGVFIGLTVFYGYWVIGFGLFYGQYWARIQRIYNGQGEDLSDLSGFYGLDKPSRAFLVARHQGQTVGTIAMRECNSLTSVKLWRMFVDPNCRRMGIASKLIAAIMEVAQSRGLFQSGAANSRHE